MHQRYANVLRYFFISQSVKQNIDLGLRSIIFVNESKSDLIKLKVALNCVQRFKYFCTDEQKH